MWLFYLRVGGAYLNSGRGSHKRLSEDHALSEGAITPHVMKGAGEGVIFNSIYMYVYHSLTWSKSLNIRQISPELDMQWMIPIGMRMVPVSTMVLGLLFLNESPRWLYLKGKQAQSVQALTRVQNLPETHPYVEHELNDYERQLEHELDITSRRGFIAVLKELFSRQVRFRLFLECIMQNFLNSTAVNAINISP